MIIGHQKIRERLSRSAEKGSFVQTYIFVGPESVGKFAVAREFALKLIGGSDAIAARSHQLEIDICVVEPEREVEKGIVKEKDISVERAREAVRFLGNFPYAGQRKVLIIRDAHRLTEAAQNALLKTLEEPPSYAVIILMTHELGKILPTTLSRCQQIPFHLITSKEMSEQGATDPLFASLPSQKTFLLELGRPGLVIQSLQKEAEFKDRMELLENLLHLSEKPLRDRLALSEACVKNNGQTMQLLMWWVGGLHARVADPSSQEDLTGLQRIEKIEKLRTDLKRFPSSARVLLDTFFLHW